MNTITTALGYALLHFLWQGALLALPLAIFRTQSRTRYRLACVLFFAMPVAFAITFLLVLPPRFGHFPLSAPPAFEPTSGLAAGVDSASPLIDAFIQWYVPLWIAGVCLLYVRGFGSWLTVRAIRHSASADVPGWCIERMNRISSTLRIGTAVTLLESTRVDVPVVIGFLRPAILFPAGLLTGLPADQMEHLLVHELSHIRRFDYLVNLLQTTVEGLLFYHPAVWWVSAVLRAERENCCDDAVLAFHADPKEYAITLATLERNRWRTAQAASGGDLATRIRRVLAPRPRLAPVPFISLAFVALSCVAVAAVLPRPPHTLFQTRQAVPQLSPWQKWLKEDVVYLISDRERAAFNNLATDEEREHFVQQFWEFRGPGFKEEHYRRVAYANDRFSAGVPGWKTDLGRIYIVYGPPDEIDAHLDCSAKASAYYDWLYRAIPGIGVNVKIRFLDADCSGVFRMTMDPNPPKP